MCIRDSDSEAVSFEIDASQTLLKLFFENGEADVVSKWKSLSAETESGPLVNRLFGNVRSIYKRVANFSFIENEDLYLRLAQRPYWDLVAKSHLLAEHLSTETGTNFSPTDVLIDAPPVGLEVQFNVDVFYPKQDRYRTLGSVSPVVNTLAKQQFDDFVKQVRVFVVPEKVDVARRVDIEKLIKQITSAS